MSLKHKINIIKSILKERSGGELLNLMQSCLSLIIEPAIVKSRPILVQIEPTTNCNLRCKMCINPKKIREIKNLDFDSFKEILDKLNFVRQISLVGAGEPLLNPDLLKMLAYAKSKGKLIGFATNGMLLSEGFAKELLTTRIDWINISMDSADKNKYEEIRDGSDFNLVIRNLQSFMKMKGLDKKPEVSLWFVITKYNFKELNGVIKLSRKLGIKKVFAQFQHSWGHVEFGLGELNQPEIFDLKNLLLQARKVARYEKIDFRWQNIPNPDSNRVCNWPWKSCYITADGFVTPCCLQGSDPGVINFGNILGSEFGTIWNSKAYRDFRIKLKSKDIPRVCVNCTSYFENLLI